MFVRDVTAGQTERVSVTSGGPVGNGDSWSRPTMSRDGRLAAFRSNASNLIPGDTNGVADIFVRDGETGAIERVSLATGGAEGDAGCEYNPAISADGRYVAFMSRATNLAAGDTNGVGDIFVRDRQTSTTVLVSVGMLGAPANGESDELAISADGRFVAFRSFASNLVPLDGNFAHDVFVRDLVAGTTERVSVGPAGVQADNWSGYPSISADGRFVAFNSWASNLVTGDNNATGDIFVHDRTTHTTERVSVASNGAEAGDISDRPSISADGRYVAFQSLAPDLAGIPMFIDHRYDVFVHDRTTNATELVSIATSGEKGTLDSTDPFISADGRWVVFWSAAPNLVTGDDNHTDDIFIRDRLAGLTERASVQSDGSEANSSSAWSSISADGRCVAFGSYASNLVPGDANGAFDVFVRIRW